MRTSVCNQDMRTSTSYIHRKLKSTRPATEASHGSRTRTITVPFTHQAYTDPSDLKIEDFGSHPAIRRTRRDI